MLLNPGDDRKHLGRIRGRYAISAIALGTTVEELVRGSSLIEQRTGGTDVLSVVCRTIGGQLHPWRSTGELYEQGMGPGHLRLR